MQVIRILIIQSLAVFLAITVHEYTKAKVSYKMGDVTPRNNGRLSLNPMKHFEPIGFIFMLFTGCGWGKPVSTSSLHYKNRKKDTLLVYTIPSMVNILVGILFALFSIIFINNPIISEDTFFIMESIGLFIIYSAYYNVCLAIFNILPIYPLDGAKVLSVTGSPNLSTSLENNQQIFQMIMVLFIIMGFIPYLVHMIANVILIGFIPNIGLFMKSSYMFFV